MEILVVNDDGITCPGIHLLAKTAKKYGHVTVVSPDSQCSAMSQKLTITGELLIKRHLEFPVDGVDAYSVSGTPADCVKLATKALKLNPDIVFSGINRGYNVGSDIAYSGTIGAAYEALQGGIPAIAFSTSFHSDYAVVKQEIDSVIEELLHTPIEKNALFNVNFPGCSLEDYHGIKKDAIIASTQFYLDSYKSFVDPDGVIHAIPNAEKCDVSLPNTDIYFINNGYTAISKVINPVLGA